jgi:hypothetical protein
MHTKTLKNYLTEIFMGIGEYTQKFRRKSNDIRTYSTRKRFE